MRVLYRFYIGENGIVVRTGLVMRERSFKGEKRLRVKLNC